MLISVALLLYEFAGGSVDSISILGGGLKLTNPEVVIWFAYVALLYFLWRYWIHAVPVHHQLAADLQDALLPQKGYRALTQPHIDEFRKDSGIEGADWFAEAAAKITEDEKSYIPVPIESKVEKGLFSRTLSLKIGNPRGDFDPHSRTVSLSFLRYQVCWLRALIDAMINKRAFSELLVPYLVFLSAVVISVWNRFLS